MKRVELFLLLDHPQEMDESRKLKPWERASDNGKNWILPMKMKITVEDETLSDRLFLVIEILLIK